MSEHTVSLLNLAVDSALLAVILPWFVLDKGRELGRAWRLWRVGPVCDPQEHATEREARECRVCRREFAS